MISRRIIFDGDRVACQQVLGRANSLLNLLQTRMMNGSLDQGWSRHILPSGEVIKCSIQFGVPQFIISPLGRTVS